MNCAAHLPFGLQVMWLNFSMADLLGHRGMLKSWPRANFGNELMRIPTFSEPQSPA